MTSVSSVEPEASIMACLVGNKTVWVKGFKIAFGAWLTLSAENKNKLVDFFYLEICTQKKVKITKIQRGSVQYLFGDQKRNILTVFWIATFLGPLFAKLWNQVSSLDHFVVQNSGDFLCWKYKEVVCFYVSNLRQ